MSCACDSNSPNNGSSGLPPGGASSGKIGNAVLPQSPCKPLPCPSPPIIDEEERPPYCPLWVRTLTNLAKGKLLIAATDCLYTLKSKCNGWLYHDAGTGEISVQQPPFVSSNPQEVEFGFLAKVVPTRRRICDDSSDECAEEIVQEIAAQKLTDESAGRLLIARPPMCGEIGAPFDASAADQVHVGYLEPEVLKGCHTGAFILVGYPDKMGPSGQKVDVTRFAKTSRLRFKRSQWGGLTLEVDIRKAKQAVLVPVAGGDPEDPCMELRFIDTPGVLPFDPDNCDIAVFTGKDTDTAGWKAMPKGLSFHPLETPQALTNITTAGTNNRVLPNFPTTEQACGAIFAVFQTRMASVPGPSSSPTSLDLTLGNYRIGFSGNNQNTSGMEARAKVTNSSVDFILTVTGTGSGTAQVNLIGYEY